MAAKENEHLEFKEAKFSFEFDKLLKYCGALANEGGGRMILGVTNRLPRRVVGSQAFADLERTKAALVERLRLRLEVLEIAHPDGRVLAFIAPSRPLGVPIAIDGAYWMRAGEDLVPMTPDMLRRIFAETGPDFSAESCTGALMEDLDGAAIDRFRWMWRRKSGIPAIEHASAEQLLEDAELTVDGKVTYAALVLLGTRPALGRHLGQAEVIFEYRSSDAAGPAQQRLELRTGFLLFLDDLWQTVNLRNDLQHFQDGLFYWDIPTFSEAAVREAILNAVSHRDYRLPGSVFVRQFARRIEVVSPGGFLPGITPENFLWKQAPRNRRLAEALGKCGLVERAGQGANRMFEACIREGKRRPDLSGTDEHEVRVRLPGEVQDPRFLRFLEKVGQETETSFSTEDLLVLDLVQHEQPVGSELADRLTALTELGALERIGRGRGARHMLSRRFYGFLGERGRYTRHRGLDRGTNKALLQRHIDDNREEGSPLSDLLQVLPALSRQQVKRLLWELRDSGRVASLGRTRGARWYPKD
jgi:ATP-dependent DNA helicase RecG